nr:hypothetical protein [Sneathiella litorea]
MFVSVTLLLAFSNPHKQFPAPTSGEGVIGRENEQAERYHPKSENGEKSKSPADDKRPSEYKTSDLGLWVLERLFGHS